MALARLRDAPPGRTNRLLHMVAVPLFMLASVLIVLSALMPSFTSLVAGIVGLVLSVAIQGRGHHLEAVPTETFAGPANLVGRLVVEQWVTFPRFVLSGGGRTNFTRPRKI